MSFKVEKERNSRSIATNELPNIDIGIFVVAFFYFILSRLLYLAYSAKLGLLCMPHPGMGPLI